MTIEKYLQNQNNAKISIANEVKENLFPERELIEIRLLTLAEVFKAVESGFSKIFIY